MTELLGLVGVVARVGSPDPSVKVGTMTSLAKRGFRDPLDLLVVPGEYHLLETDAMVELARAEGDVGPRPK